MKYDTTTDNDTATLHGVYALLRDMSRDIRKQSDQQYEYQHETRHDIADLRERLTRLETSDVKHDKDIEILKSDVTDLKSDMKSVRQELHDIHGEVRELSGMMTGMQTRLNWWLVIAGIILALMQYLRS